MFHTINYIIKNKTAVGLWKICGPSVVLFQTLAALEVRNFSIFAFYILLIDVSLTFENIFVSLIMHFKIK